jgi:hypothetical protein
VLWSQRELAHDVKLPICDDATVKLHAQAGAMRVAILTSWPHHPRSSKAISPYMSNQFQLENQSENRWVVAKYFQFLM